MQSGEVLRDAKKCDNCHTVCNHSFMQGPTMTTVHDINPNPNLKPQSPHTPNRDSATSQLRP